MERRRLAERRWMRRAPAFRRWDFRVYDALSIPQSALASIRTGRGLSPEFSCRGAKRGVYYKWTGEGGCTMPRMPEIVGESQDTDPHLEENRPAEPVEERLWPRRTSRASRERYRQSGIMTSPLMLRLIDFSGEGERAPPEPSLQGRGPRGRRTEADTQWPSCIKRVHGWPEHASHRPESGAPANVESGRVWGFFGGIR